VTGQGGLREVVTATTEGGRTTYYVKVVNFGAQQQSATLQIQGVSRFDGGTDTVLTGDPRTRRGSPRPAESCQPSGPRRGSASPASP
jgi:hypothetical protein